MRNNSDRRENTILKVKTRFPKIVNEINFKIPIRANLGTKEELANKELASAEGFHMGSNKIALVKILGDLSVVVEFDEEKTILPYFYRPNFGHFKIRTAYSETTKRVETEYSPKEEIDEGLKKNTEYLIQLIEDNQMNKVFEIIEWAILSRAIICTNIDDEHLLKILRAAHDRGGEELLEKICENIECLIFDEYIRFLNHLKRGDFPNINSRYTILSFEPNETLDAKEKARILLFKHGEENPFDWSKGSEIRDKIKPLIYSRKYRPYNYQRMLMHQKFPAYEKEVVPRPIKGKGKGKDLQMPAHVGKGKGKGKGKEMTIPATIISS